MLISAFVYLFVYQIPSAWNSFKIRFKGRDYLCSPSTVPGKQEALGECLLNE